LKKAISFLCGCRGGWDSSCLPLSVPGAGCGVRETGGGGDGVCAGASVGVSGSGGALGGGLGAWPQPRRKTKIKAKIRSSPLILTHQNASFSITILYAADDQRQGVHFTKESRSWSRRACICGVDLRPVFLGLWAVNRAFMPEKKLATPRGFEPLISTVTGCHVVFPTHRPNRRRPTRRWPGGYPPCWFGLVSCESPSASGMAVFLGSECAHLPILCRWLVYQPGRPGVKAADEL